MKTQKLILFTLAALFTLSSCTGIDKQAVRRAVQRQMTDFPESRLQDLYKSFFQDRFGPGHIISDRASALNYIRSEMQQADTLVGPLTEPCGWEENYVRISLAAVSQGLISADDLTDALLQSAIEIPEEALPAWEKEWKAILSVIEKDYPDIPDLAADKQTLDSLLAAREYAYHHSEIYNRLYHPHYRIIRKALVQNLLPE